MPQLPFDSRDCPNSGLGLRAPPGCAGEDTAELPPCSRQRHESFSPEILQYRHKRLPGRRAPAKVNSILSRKGSQTSRPLERMAQSKVSPRPGPLPQVLDDLD